MADNAEDFGQEAYGQFYLPLTEKLREHGVDSINPQQHGFSGRWRTFHTGYELDFVHLGGVGEDIGELSVNCGWGFSAVGFQPSALYNQAA